jgi:choloylglycine hydrolase
MKTRNRWRFALVTAFATAVIGLATSKVQACTRILSNTYDRVLTARTMDWPESTDPVLTVLPRGLRHDGGHIGTSQVVAANPLVWTSRYGSVVTTVYGLGAADGLNERGLGAHMLYLTAADYGPRDTSRPGLHAGLWAQYVLDSAATVTEALALLDKVQVVLAEAHGHKATVHLALEDALGDSAIIEIVGGKSIVHHGREFRVMTNDPPYDEQLALLKTLDFTHPTSDTPLPGNVNPRDRFQRASYYLAILPRPDTERAGVAGMFAIARNVSVPFGAPYKGFGIYNTEYRTVTDLSERLYFFELTTSPNVIWTDLKKFKLSPGAPVMLLHPDRIDLSGDVSRHFTAGVAPY